MAHTLISPKDPQCFSIVTEGGYNVAVRNRPARQCGGDYYDALPARALW